MSAKVTRRRFLRAAGLIGASAGLAACAPRVVEKAVEVEKEVTQVVEKQVTKVVPGTTIQFWTMNYGDPAQWLDMFKKYAAEFQEKTGIGVDVQMINWAQGMNTWLLVARGGAHPDCADMYWLHSFASIGGKEYGPLPITEYQQEYWPDLKERFFEGSLKDVYWQGEFYGIPWRGDIRPMIYRVDFLEEAGFSKPPDTWEELREYAKALTVRDSNGNVLRWGFLPGGANPCQNFMPWVWQAGGEFMTADGKTATIDTPAMAEALEFLYQLQNVDKVIPPEWLEPSFAPMDYFAADKAAIVFQVPDDWAKNLERDYPELDGKWAYEIPVKNKTRACYSGAGYWGCLRGTTRVEEAVQWIHYLSQDSIMTELSQYLGRVSPNKNVMNNPFWQEKEWRKKIVACLEHAHTSQHPSPAWSRIIVHQPGAPIYDMVYEVMNNNVPIPDAIARCQKRVQEEMDKGAS